MEKDRLYNILSDLSPDDLEDFKWFLNNEYVLKNFKTIPNNKLSETRTVRQLVDVLVGSYGKDATEVCTVILAKINRADLLDRLKTSMGHTGVNSASEQRRLDTGRVDHGGPQTSTAALKKDFCELTVDINSAHRFLQLTHDNRTAESGDVIQPYPEHPDRFDIWCQALCSPALPARCYWEVQWSGEVQVAVSYRSINRKGGGGDCVVGENPLSWSLWCSADGHSVRHDKVKTVLPHSSASSGRVAVAVDRSAGRVSFYKVCSGDLVHLHTFNTAFNQPLYAAFWFGPRSSVSLCDV